MMPTSSRPHALILTGLLAGCWLVAAPSTAQRPPAGEARGTATTASQRIDSFYLELYRQGTQGLGEGRFRRAAEDLRLACFGMLDEPVLLGECLVRLSVAQAAGDDKEAFAETFRRLATLEERFGAYRQADLSAADRATYESWLVRLIPETQLASVATFAPLAVEREAAKLRQLAPAKRRPQIASRLESDSRNPLWHVLLAELEEEVGNRDAASRSVENALALDPSLAAAHCLRGRLRAAAGSCAEALPELASCGESETDPANAAATLGCQLSLGQLAEARALLAALSSEVREDKRVARLGRQLDARASPAAAETTAASTAGDPPLVDAPPAGGTPQAASAALTEAPRVSAEPVPATALAPPRSAPLSAELRARIDELRRSLARTQHAGELAEPLQQARDLADANPTASEAQLLVAEIAYRASRFNEAAEYFRRGGDPGEGRPVLLFYMAVSFYEAGDLEEAATALRRCLPKLERTTFVEAYRAKILGREGEPPG